MSKPWSEIHHKKDDTLRREIAKKLQAAFLHCTHNGAQWISVNQAGRAAVTVALEAVAEPVIAWMVRWMVSAEAISRSLE